MYSKIYGCVAVFMSITFRNKVIARRLCVLVRELAFSMNFRRGWASGDSLSDSASEFWRCRLREEEPDSNVSEMHNNKIRIESTMFRSSRTGHLPRSNLTKGRTIGGCR